MVTVADEIETLAATTIEAVFSTQFTVAVPALPSSFRTFALVRYEHHVAVPVASALESAVMAFAVADAEAAAPKDVADSARSARSTCAPSAVSASVGWLESYSLNFPLALRTASPASIAALRSSVAALELSANWASFLPHWPLTGGVSVFRFWSCKRA